MPDARQDDELRVREPAKLSRHAGVSARRDADEKSVGYVDEREDIAQAASAIACSIVRDPAGLRRSLIARLIRDLARRGLR